MAEFQPLQVEAAYQDILKEMVPEFVRELELPPSVEDHTISKMEETNLRDELVEAGFDNFDVVRWAGDTDDEERVPEEFREKVKKWYGARFLNNHREQILREDEDRRTVLEFVLQGLTERRDESTTGLYVRYNSVREITGHPDLEIPLRSIDTVPSVVGTHPVTRERGLVFAAETAFIAARLLTSEIVEVVLADESRETPTVITNLKRDKNDPQEVKN